MSMHGVVRRSMRIIRLLAGLGKGKELHLRALCC